MMPIKLNIGFSRKVGEPDYGSRGASTNLELELDSAAINDPTRLREQIQSLFGIAKQSVDEELNATAHPPLNGNGEAAHNNGARNGSGRNERPATQSQVRALHAIANRQRINLGSLVGERFQVRGPEDLSLRDASSLIDELKGSENGGRL